MLGYMEIIATIKEVDGQMFVEFTGDMKDIVPVSEVRIQRGYRLVEE